MTKPAGGTPFMTKPQQEEQNTKTMTTDNSQQEFLKQELHQMLRTRYGKLTLATTIGVLEMVKWELINDCPPAENDTNEL